jgi:hypothetical protein
VKHDLAHILLGGWCSRKISVNSAWEAYIRHAGWGYQIRSILILTGLYLLFCLIIISIADFPSGPVQLKNNSYFWIIEKMFNFPPAPVRGDLSAIINKWVLPVTILSFLILTFFVLDVTSRCCRFVNIFRDKQPQWDRQSFEAFIPKEASDSDGSGFNQGSEEKDLSYLMLLQLIARRTEVVGKLIFYPFIIWLLLIFSRNHYFDNWATPWGLVLVISLTALIAWSCAFKLRWSAERLRAEMIDRFSRELMGAHSPQRIKQLQDVLEEVKSVRRGAFARYLQHPVIQTLLVPLGGISSIKLLELLGRY